MEMRSHLLLVVAIICGLLIFGCAEQPKACTNTCPAGETLTPFPECDCLPVAPAPVNATLKEGENANLSNWQVLATDISEQAAVVGGACSIGNESAEFVLTGPANESVNASLKIGENASLPDGALFSVLGIRQNATVQEKACTLEDKGVKVKVKHSEQKNVSKEIAEGGSFELSDGSTIEVREIKQDTSLTTPFDSTVNLNEGEERTLTDGTKVKLEAVSLKVTKTTTETTEITRGEGSQASLPHDYSLRIPDDGITQTVNPPSSTSSTVTLEKGNEVTAGDGTIINVDQIAEQLGGCNESCALLNESVVLKVKKTGQTRWTSYTALEGDTVNASSRVRVLVSRISQTIDDSNCSGGNGTCNVSNRQVTITITTYAESCSVTNEKVSLALVNPELDEQTATIALGDEISFGGGIKIKVKAINKTLAAPEGGACEVSNEKATLEVTLPAAGCALSEKKATVRITHGGASGAKVIAQGAEVEVITNIKATPEEINADVALNGNTCEVSNKQATVTVNVGKLCSVAGRQVTFALSTGDQTVVKTGRESNSFTEGEVKVTVAGITEQETVANDACSISNEKVTLEIAAPTILEGSLNEGERKTFSGLTVYLANLSAAVEQLDTGSCLLGEQTAELELLDNAGSTSASLKKGETERFHTYEVTVTDATTKVSDTWERRCLVSGREVDVVLTPAS